MQPTQRESRNWNPWPVCLITFFCVAILSCAAFVAFCSLHPAELVTPDYYEQEMRYQAQLSRMANARDFAGLASVRYDPSRRAIILNLPAPDPSLLPVGAIQLYRPSAAGLDRKFDLALDQRGSQRIDARTLTPGLWKVRVSWAVANKEYYIDRPIVVSRPPA